jgi:hypothetical protein
MAKIESVKKKQDKEILYRNPGKFTWCKISPENFTPWKLPSP